MNKLLVFATVLGTAALLLSDSAVGQQAYDPDYQWYYGYDSADSNTVALYHFDEGSDTIASDASASGNVGYFMGNVFPAWTEGKFGTALYFVGDDVCGVHVYDDTSIRLDSYTIEAWVKPAYKNQETNNWLGIISKTPNYVVQWQVTTGKPNWLAKDSWGPITSTGPSGALSTGEWTHLAVTWSATLEEVKIYVNGNLVKQDTLTGFVALKGDGASLFIGVEGIDESDTNPSVLTTFHGAIDEVRISNIARNFIPEDNVPSGGAVPIESVERGIALAWDSAETDSTYRVGWKDDLTEDSWTTAEIVNVDTGTVVWLDSGDTPYGGRSGPLDSATGKRFYSIQKYGVAVTPPAPPESPTQWYFGYDGSHPNTVGLWHFDEGGGNTAFNAVAGNDGTFVNGTLWTTDARIDSYALAFDGVNDGVIIDLYNDITFKNSSFTIEFWLKPDAVISGTNMAPYDNAYGVQTILRSTGAYVTWYPRDQANNTYPQHVGWPAGLITQGEWHHIALTWDEDTKYQRAYVNGVLDQEDYRPGVSMYNLPYTPKITLGNTDDLSSQPYHGLIDELRISNVARVFEPYTPPPAPESPTQWYYGYDGSHPNTVGLWHFDEGGGDTAFNAVAGEDGSLVNGVLWTADARIGSNALDFDGVNDAVLIDLYNEITYQNSSFTIEFWLKPDTVISGTNMAPYDNPYGVQTILRATGDYLTWYPRDQAGTTYPQHVGWPAGLIVQGQWTHIALTWDQENKLLRSYVNGVLDKVDYLAGVSMYNNSAVPLITLGNSNDLITQPYHGLIDELRISDVAREFDPI